MLYYNYEALGYACPPKYTTTAPEDATGRKITLSVNNKVTYSFIGFIIKYYVCKI